MSIVINTPSGNIGNTLANLLLDVGEPLTIISRNPDKVKHLTDRGAQLVEGSFDDRAVLEQALKGARSLFWVTPPPARPDFHDWAIGAARTAADVARAAVLQNVVVLSSVGAHFGPGSGPVGVCLDIELVFQRAIANVAMLRAGFFMENLLRDIPGIISGTVYSPLKADAKVAMVATKDIAHKAAAYLLAKHWAGHIIDAAHGPRHLSPGEAFAEIGKLLGRDIKYVEVPVRAARQAMAGFGMPDFLVTIYAAMYEAMIDGRMAAAEPRTPMTTTPTTLAEFVRTTLGPAVNAAMQAAAKP